MIAPQRERDATTREPSTRRHITQRHGDIRNEIAREARDGDSKFTFITRASTRMLMPVGDDEAGARSQRQRRRHRGADATTAAAWYPKHHTRAAAIGRLPSAPLASTVVSERRDCGVKGRDGGRRSRTGGERRSSCGARLLAGGGGDVPLGTSVCCCLDSAWGSANTAPHPPRTFF